MCIPSWGSCRTSCQCSCKHRVPSEDESLPCECFHLASWWQIEATHTQHWTWLQTYHWISNTVAIGPRKAPQSCTVHLTQSYNLSRLVDSRVRCRLQTLFLEWKSFLWTRGLRWERWRSSFEFRIKSWLTSLLDLRVLEAFQDFERLRCVRSWLEFDQSTTIWTKAQWVIPRTWSHRYQRPLA